MAITTYTDFVEHLGALTISGVATKLGKKPDVLNAADLPASWVELPEGLEGTLTSGTHGGWPTITAELRVAVQATELGRHPDNYAVTLGLLDNISEALRAVPLFRKNGTNTANLGKGPVTWTLRVEFIFIGQVEYWTIITTVTGHG